MQVSMRKLNIRHWLRVLSENALGQLHRLKILISACFTDAAIGFFPACRRTIVAYPVVIAKRVLPVLLSRGADGTVGPPLV